MKINVIATYRCPKCYHPITNKYNEQIIYCPKCRAQMTLVGVHCIPVKEKQEKNKSTLKAVSNFAALFDLAIING